MIGRPVRRLEDPRRLRGEGVYVDDVRLPDMLHAAVVRSPHAHARLRAVDAAAARAAPGVAAVFTARDLADALRPIPVRLVPDPNLLRYLQHPLAVDRVRYVGEPVALVVARDRAAAEDAAERVEMDFEPLPAVTDAGAAPPPAALFDHAPDNLASLIEEGFGDLDAAFARARRIVRLSFRTGRHTAVPMETRGLVAAPDRGAGRGAQGRARLTVWGPTKVPHFNRGVLAAMLGWPEHRIRLVEPEVGGGFGARGEFYPEDFLIPCAALRLGRPVKWIEDRAEHLCAINHSREQRYELALALDADGRFLGLDAEAVNDMGAYLRTHGTVVPGLSAGMLPGPYEMEAYRCRMRCVLTNKTPTGTYRAPGRFECNAARERLIDRAARVLGIDPVEIRRRNLIRPERMPFARGTAILGEEVEYDSGDYPHALDEAVALSGFSPRSADAGSPHGPASGRSGDPGAGGGEGTDATATATADAGADAEVAARPAAGAHLAAPAQMPTPARTPGAEAGDAAPAAGRYRLGTGLACFVEKTGTGPFEGARAFLDRSGDLVVATGASDLGQGLETCLAQIAADALGIGCERVVVRHGDTDLIPHGVGSFASRGTVMAGNAAHAAARELRARVLERAASRLGARPGDLSIDPAGAVRSAAGRSCSLAELAAEPGLEAVHYFRCGRMAYSHGVTVARVRVDTATGHVAPERIWLLYDVGRVVNPAMVAGQIEGGVAQGLGGALLEELRYDETGQLLSGSFMDYLLPGAADVPRVVHRNLDRSPSPRNPLGVKGAGEVGIAGVGGAIANAVADALGDADAEADGLPLTPERVWARARARAGARTSGPGQGPGRT